MRTSIATLVMLACAGACAPALATTSVRGNEQQDVRLAVVHYGDLNLDTAKGAETLYRRMNGAAHRVCSDGGMPSYSIVNHDYQLCRQTAIEQAVEKIDRPKVTVLYDRHFPEYPLPGAIASGRGSRSLG
jgi:UrcA family protein